jgi:hypothetical protein
VGSWVIGGPGGARGVSGGARGVSGGVRSGPTDIQVASWQAPAYHPDMAKVSVASLRLLPRDFLFYNHDLNLACFLF